MVYCENVRISGNSEVTAWRVLKSVGMAPRTRGRSGPRVGAVMQQNLKHNARCPLGAFSFGRSYKRKRYLMAVRFARSFPISLTPSNGT